VPGAYGAEMLTKKGFFGIVSPSPSSLWIDRRIAVLMAQP
jgi:hypothetical protein